MAQRKRTNISWTQEDTFLQADLSRFRGKAIGVHMKLLAMTGLMLERLGITMYGNGVISGMADHFMTEPARQLPEVKAPPARPKTMSMSKPLGT